MSNQYHPNTFQKPNFITDDLLWLLTPEEYVVLDFAIRHIRGWIHIIEKHGRPIALSVFENGFSYDDDDGNTKVFHGTGLARGTIISALKGLDKYNILKKEGEPTLEGQYWHLQESSTKIDWGGLMVRKTEKSAKNKRRTQSATSEATVVRNAAKGSPSDEPTQSVGRTEPSPSDEPTQSVGRTEPSPSDEHIQTHLKTHEETQMETQGSVAPTARRLFEHQEVVPASQKRKRKKKQVELAPEQKERFTPLRDAIRSYWGYGEKCSSQTYARLGTLTRELILASDDFNVDTFKAGMDKYHRENDFKKRRPHEDNKLKSPVAISGAIDAYLNTCDLSGGDVQLDSARLEYMTLMGLEDTDENRRKMKIDYSDQDIRSLLHSARRLSDDQ